MKGSSKVSIVIACYNDPDIVIAVRSAWDQTYPNKEIIVVDDGSDAKTKHKIQSVIEFISILVTQENSGQSIARNNGIKRATGKYILNLDSDDFFEPTFCEKAVLKFKEDKEIKIVTCQAYRFNKEGNIDIFTPKGGPLKDFLYSNSALGSSMFKKEDWEQCGGYEEKLPILGIEDWEFYINILKEGGYAYAHVIPEVLFHYQIRKNSTTDRIRKSRHDKFRQIIFKHKDLYSANFELTVDHFTERLNKLESDKHKIFNEADFKFGNILLKPFRFFKKRFKG